MTRIISKGIRIRRKEFEMQGQSIVLRYSKATKKIINHAINEIKITMKSEVFMTSKGEVIYPQIN